MVDDTTEDSSPELNADDPDASDEDSSAEEPLKPAKGTPDKANERIRELIEQRNNLAAQLRAAQSQGAPDKTDSTFEGVTPEGIDPEKFAAGLEKRLAGNTAALANQQVLFQVQLVEVRKDPVMKSKVAQEHVSSLINQGFTPTDALEIYKDDLKTIEAEILEKNKVRKEATAASRQGTTLPSSGKTSAPSGTFTWEQVDKMPMEEYAKNQAEIKRQAAAGLIK